MVFTSALTRNRLGICWIAVLGCALITSTALGVQPKQPGSFLSSKEFYEPDLYISNSNEPLAAVLGDLPNRAAWEAFLSSSRAVSGQDTPVFIDPRSGTAVSIINAFPVIPGEGVGNSITLDSLGSSLGRAVHELDERVVGDAFYQLADELHKVLGVQRAQLGEIKAGQAAESLWHVAIGQSYQGIPVRYGRVVAAISHGNVVVLGTESWGNVEGLSTTPRISADEALKAGFDYVGGRAQLDRVMQQPTLEVIPYAPAEHQLGEGFGGPVGKGYGHRLAWVFTFNRAPELENWEVLVDAHTGSLLSFQDMNLYDNNEIIGGVYPITSTEICPTNGTCGVMQPGWPMPFADTGLAAPNNFTNSAGLVGGNPGTVNTTLSGQFVNINDNCGAVNNSGAGGIDLGGVNGQHDCTTGGGSSGNTPASRTAFYELNKLVEMAQGWLPGNGWMQNTLTATLNINNNCNAFWNGSTVNFYTSGGGCRNTGELAGVFDHEWGHGLDDNDTLGSLSNTSEAYADMVNILRLHDSCVGHGFSSGAAGSCGLTADGTGPNRNESQTGGSHCDTNCSGVRDADWGRHADNNPDTPLNFVCSECLTGPGPCGRQVHCSAAPARQAAWDLAARDLPFDRQTNFVIANKIFYQGSGAVGTWYSCTCTSSQNGCGSGGGYLQWLAADDDNGNINDGTPHMTAIFNAFDRHGIACGSPTPTNSGCGAGPTTPPTLSVNGGENSASLSWNNIAGAEEYWVFRTEGHAGCDFGKARIAQVAGTSFTDTEVAGGREYWYSVMAADSNNSCFTALSNCANVTPTMPGAGAPAVTITAPADGSMSNDGDSVTFTGTAIDPQDGDISGSIQWSSSIDGSFGSGASVTISTLSVGSHTITASATDSDTLTGTDQISFTVKPACDTEVYSTGFETDDGGWTTGPGQTCTTGTFIRGTPDQVVDGVTTQPAGAASGTFAWFTQNNTGGLGVDDVDGGTCETLSPVINVDSDVSIFVDFFHGQRDAGDDAGDGMSIEVIDANTSAVLATLVSFGDVANNAVWTSIADTVAGAPSQIRLRVRASDAAATGDLVEAGIDNIQVCSGGCTVDADCDNGLFCDGAETCNVATGSCEAGTPPDCNDGVGCTVDSCNEGTDSCDNTPDNGACDNGLFCDGAETCDPVLDCQAGTPVDCNDGVGCTVDSCNEGTDSCDNVPNDAACDDGLFCNGAETCDAVLDCQPGSDPCSGGACDEAGDVCLECSVDADCDDGLFCTGVETCVGGACQASGDPCGAGETCNEGTDACDPAGNCDHSADFEAGAGGWTNGADTCTTGAFIVGTPDATTWQVGGGNPGQAFFTANNPGGIGTDDVDGGTCEALSPVVDCSGVAAAAVSLDYFHGQRDAADDAADGFTIEVLNNGAVVDTMVAIGDVTNNPAWTNVSTVVNNPGNIQVRVRATDAAGPGDIVEGGIDNVSITAAAPQTCSVDDDFEDGSVPEFDPDPASTCTTGTYVLGNPTQQVSTVVTQPAGSASGVFSIFTATNTAAGTNDVDGGNCILSTTTPYVVPAPSTLSIAYFHGQRDAGDDPAGDFFSIEWSNDGGATWNTVVSNGDTQSVAAWSTATAQVPAGNIDIRVQCSDGAGPGDIVECGIDDLSICE